MCEFKLDTGSDGNLMCIRMYRTLFLQTNINELNEYINKINSVMHLQYFSKGIEYGCSFFVVKENRPELLGMPDCIQLKLLSVNYQTTDAENDK